MSEIKFMENPRAALDPQIFNLQSESKLTRKIALESINKEIFDNPQSRDCDLSVVFHEIYAYILKSFSDNSEACRNVACTIISNFIERLPLNDYYLTYIMPVVVRRIGCPEIVEESEELRLTLVTLVHKIIEKYKASQLLAPFMNEFSSIFTKVSTDPFPKVKLEACECIILLSTAVHRDFHFQSEGYVKPVLSNFSHQHFRVRVAAIKAIGAIVLAGTAKCFELSITPMAEKLFDENTQVRMQVTLEVGNWMLNLRDRYSFWHRMIPLLLTSLSDVMADIRGTATKLWDDVGLQFLEENEEDLKKRTDFLMDVPTHYPDVKRPNIGCRQLVQRNIGKIVPAIEREMDGWQADPRLRVSQLLCWLILCAEEGSTQHTAAIIRTLHRGAKDDDERVVLEVKRASKLLGYFITPDIWWPLLEADMDSWGALCVLTNLLTGSQAEHVQGKVMQSILKEIIDPDRCQSRKLKYQENLLRLVEALMDLCGEACRPSAREIFTICFTVYAMPVDDKMAFMALSNLDKLRAIEDCGRPLASLYKRHIGSVLASIVGDARTWTPLTAELCLLQCTLLNSGSAMGDQLHLIAPLLNDCLGTRDVDPEVRLKMFTTLSTVIMNRQINFSSCEKDKLQGFLKIIINDVIKPNLVWSPGRTAEAIRTAAVACLCSALQPPASAGPAHAKCDGAGDTSDHVELFPDKEVLEKFLDEMIPVLTGLVDDNAALTRQYTLRTISHLAVLAQKKGCFTSERLHKLYFPVLKRLDDSCDRARSLALGCVRALFERRPAPYDTITFGAHVDALYSAMLVHLDDSDEDFRKEMLDALLGLSDVDPKLLEKKVKANIHLYRNKAAYERLATHIASLKI